MAELRDMVIMNLEAAIVAEAREVLGKQRSLSAKFNEETGRVELFQTFAVVEVVSREGEELALANAREIVPSAQIGNVLSVRLYYDAADNVEVERQQAMAFLALPAKWRYFDRVAAECSKKTIVGDARRKKSAE